MRRQPSALPTLTEVQRYIRAEVTLNPEHLGRYGPLTIAGDLSTASREYMDASWYRNLTLRCLRMMTEDQIMSILVACYAGQRCAQQGTVIDEDFQVLIGLIEERLRAELNPDGNDKTGAVLVGDVFREAAEMAHGDHFPLLCGLVNDRRALCAVCIRGCPQAGR